jgi:hypothetical protein
MFIWRRLSSLRTRALFMVGLPLLSMVSLFSPLLTADVSAVTIDEMQKKAEVWVALRGIIQYPEDLKRSVSIGDVNSCNFLESDNSIHGPKLSSGNLATIGKSCVEIAKALGYSAPSGSQGNYTIPNSYSSNAVLDALSAAGISSANMFYGGNLRTGEPSDAIGYAIASNFLKRSCTVGFRTELLNPIPGYNEDPANNQRVDWMREGGTQNTPLNKDEADTAANYHFWMWSYENGKVSKNIYHGGSSMDDFFDIGAGAKFIVDYQTGPRDADSPWQADCYQAARLLQDNNKYANGYASVIKPGSDFTPGTCADRYGSNEPKQLAACDAGFKNKGGASNFCDVTYPNATERAACVYGQGPATGGADTTTPAPSSEPGGGEATDRTTCVIEGVGWIICPVFNLLAKITDGAYILVDNLLVVEPLPLTTSKDVGIFNAWSIMRNFANVAFVIFFLVIIFSQLTSVGINNYGIKKLLPKLVVAAILVNISYWICAIAVDFSNILGGSIKGVLDNIQVDAGTETKFTTWAETSSGLLGGSLAGIVVGSTLFFATLSVLLPMLVIVLATIVTVFLTLVLRQVFIVILIVISPLAFVAYLLPNTESFTKKWRTTFQLMLLIYPIIALVFGGSALAATIIMASSDDWYIQIAGAAAGVIPLVAAPALISGINKVANRFGLPNVGVKFGGIQKRAEGYSKYRKNVAAARRIGGTNAFRTDKLAGAIKGSGSSRFRRSLGAIIGAPGEGASWRERSKRTQEDRERGAEQALNKTWSDYKVAELNNNPNYAKQLAGPTGDIAKIQAAAVAAQKNETAEAIKNAQLSADIPPGSPGIQKMADMLAEAINKGDTVQARAMQNMLLTSGSAGLSKYRESMQNTEDTLDPTSATGQALRENLLTNHSAVKATANDIMQQAITGQKMSVVSADPKTWNLSDSDLVHQKAASLELALNSGAVTKEQAMRIASNDEIAQNLDPNIREKFEDIATRS